MDTRTSRIHPTAIIEDGVTIGSGCEIGPYAVLHRGTVLGERVKVDCHVVLGGAPQVVNLDENFESGVEIGEGTVLREGVTVSRATKPGGMTRIGKNTLLMANCHVGHDSQIGNHVIMANGAIIAGHCLVEDYAFVSATVLLHQFCRIGENAMVSGGSRISLDVPRFSLASERNHISGLNLVGLKRRGLTSEAIRDIKRLFHEIYLGSGPLAERAARLSAETPEGQRFLEFYQTSRRGVARPGYPSGGSSRDD